MMMEESEMSFLQKRKYKKGRGYAEEIMAFIRNEINGQRNVMKRDQPNNFLQRYLIKIDEEGGKNGYSDEQLVHIVFDLFLAGADTLGVLRYLFYEFLIIELRRDCP